MTKLTEKRTITTPSGVVIIINDKTLITSGTSATGQPLGVLLPTQPLPKNNNKVMAHHFIHNNTTVKGE
jgi:hypothetical protein